VGAFFSKMSLNAGQMSTKQWSNGGFFACQSVLTGEKEAFA